MSKGKNKFGKNKIITIMSSLTFWLNWNFRLVKLEHASWDTGFQTLFSYPQSIIPVGTSWFLATWIEND